MNIDTKSIETHLSGLICPSCNRSVIAQIEKSGENYQLIFTNLCCESFGKQLDEEFIDLMQEAIGEAIHKDISDSFNDLNLTL